MSRTFKPIDLIKFTLQCFFLLIFLIDFEILLANKIEFKNNDIWTPAKLIEKFENRKIVDTNNYLDLNGENEELLQINQQIKSLEELGLNVNIYIIDAIPDDYSYELLFNKFKNSEKFLKEISQLLSDYYEQDQSKSIVAVLALDDKILDFYKEESFLLGINEKNKNTIRNYSMRYFENNKVFYAKALIRFLSKLNEYYGSPLLNCEIKLFAFFIISAVFYKLYYILKTVYLPEEPATPVENEIFNLSTIFPTENDPNQDHNRLLSVSIFHPRNSGFYNNHQNNNDHQEAGLHREPQSNTNLNFNGVMNVNNFNTNYNFYNHNDSNSNYNNLPLYYVENNINGNSYKKNIDKIKDLLKNTKLNRHRYLQNTCIICLEPFKNNKNNLNNLEKENESRFVTIKNDYNINSSKNVDCLKIAQNQDQNDPAKSNKCLINKNVYKKLYNEGRHSLNGLLIKTEENPLKKLIDEEEENALNDINSTFIECGHAFHSNCLQEWISKSNKCPICRLKITGYLNNKDINEKSNLRKSLSNKSTIFSEFKAEQDFGEFLLGIQKVMHSDISNNPANTRSNTLLESSSFCYSFRTNNDNYNNNFNSSFIHNNFGHPNREHLRYKESHFNNNPFNK